VGDYAEVQRGRHLFGGVYETYANGEAIGPVKQGRWNPWWQPSALADDNGQGWKWMARNGGMSLAEFGLLALVGVWIASAAAPVVYRAWVESR
jgi:hypothetical protein